MLSKEKIENARERLEEEKAKLMEQVEQLEEEKDFGDDVDSGDEEDDETEELSNDLASAQALKERVEEIENAFRKMQSGTYGICESCGKEISSEELDLVPETRLCVDCKLRLENR